MEAAFHSTPTFEKEFVKGVLMAIVVTRGRSFFGFGYIVVSLDLRLLLCRIFSWRCRLAWCNFINKLGCSYAGDVIEWSRLWCSRFDVWIWDKYRQLRLELMRNDDMVGIWFVRSSKNWTKWCLLLFFPCWRSLRDVWGTQYWRRKWLTQYLVFSSFDKIGLNPIPLIWQHVHSWMPGSLFKWLVTGCL